MSHKNGSDDNDITPHEPLISVNPINRPYVLTLHNLSIALGDKVKVLEKIGLTIKEDPLPVHEITRDQIADTLDESADVLHSAAEELRK